MWISRAELITALIGMTLWNGWYDLADPQTQQLSLTITIADLMLYSGLDSCQFMIISVTTMAMTLSCGGGSTLHSCFASPEEILRWQHPHLATKNRWNHHCGDDSILQAVTMELCAVEPRSGGWSCWSWLSVSLCW